MSTQTKTYAITGGSGFIGSYFCRLLQERGDKIVILDIIEPSEKSPHDRFVQGDIRDPEAVKEAFAGCDEIIHLAAAHHDFGIEEETYFDVNVGGLEVMTKVMDELGITSITFYSTVAVYGSAAPPLAEETLPEPESHYGKSKLAGEKVLESWVETGNGRHALIIRPTVTYGPDNFANMYSLLRQIDSGKFFFAKGSSNIKSLSYVENIVPASIFMLDKGCEESFAIYNYIDKPDLTSVAIAETCYESLNRPLPKYRPPTWLLLLGAKPFDLIIALTGKNLPVSTSRVKKLFVDQTKFEAQKIIDAGFVAEASVREGIDRTAQWYIETGKQESAQWHQPPKDIFTK